MSETYLSPAQAAALLEGVSAATLRRAVDQGLIKAWKVPGTGGHRRISKNDLLAYARREGIPVKEPAQ